MRLPEIESKVKGKAVRNSYDTINEYDLNADGKTETLYFRNEEIEFGDLKTHVFINDPDKSALVVEGLLENSAVHNISKNVRVLKLAMSAGGKLVNTVLYQYHEDKLIEIPIMDEISQPTPNTWSSGGSDLKDTDRNGIKELLVYHEHQPSWEMRTVDVYRYNGSSFQKDTEYEEQATRVHK